MCISLLGFILLAPSVIAYPIMYVIWGINPIEYAALMFADKPKVFEIKTYPHLHDFMGCIDMVAKNLNHVVDKKVNEY